MIGKYTIQQRVLLAVFEIIGGSLVVILLLFLSTFLLAQSGQLRFANEAKVTWSKDASVQDITRAMKDRPYDYVLYHAKNKQLLTGRYGANDINNFKLARDDRQDIVVGMATFKYFANKNYILIVRQNDLPEFSSPQLRKLSYNQFSYLFVILGILVVLGIAVIRLVRELTKNFRQVEKIALSMGMSNTAKASEQVKITEFAQILANLYQKSGELASLIERERLEKKDLSFQIGALAHDVKTPLTVVKGNLELLEMTPLTAKQATYLASISKSITVFERYFNSLLVYVRLLNAEQRADIDLKKFISELTVEFKEIAKTYQVELSLETKIASETFGGERLALSRAVLNIFVNACQHAKKDAGKVRVLIKETTTQLVFEIWNNGAPFSEVARENATKLFFTENGGRNLDNEHYGIGLAFAQAVSLKHGGQLEIANGSGEGAQVSLIIKKR